MQTALQQMTRDELIELIQLRDQRLAERDERLAERDQRLAECDVQIEHKQARILDLEFLVKQLQRLAF